MKKVKDEYEYDIETIAEIIGNYGSEGTEIIMGEKKYGQPEQEPKAIDLNEEEIE